jgi:hypothetical protein
MSFHTCTIIELKAFERLRPLLHETSDGKFVVTSKGRLAPLLQGTIGDVLYNDRSGRMWSVEIKAEKKNKWGNFFLETWSNRNLEDADSHALRGSNVGWLAKLRADLLFYYFIECDSLYVINLLGLKRWAFGFGERPRQPSNGRIYAFPERLQEEYEQLNDTWGRCVPISVLMAEVRPTPKLLHPRQLNLWPEAAE